MSGLSAGALYSNTTDTEDSVARIASLDTNGFTTSSTNYTYTNNNAEAYVAWSWKKSATAGMDIITWTGNDSGGFAPAPQSVTHSLNVAPELIIAKSRTQNTFNNFNWVVWHKDLTSGNYLLLNGNGGETGWGDALVSSIDDISVSFGSDAMMSGEDLNAGASFGSVEGHSKVGSYTGNASADGAFVYCGFRPSYVMIKNIDASSPWYIVDSARSPYNEAVVSLEADVSDAEQTDANFLDLSSNGFKLRTTGGHVNGSGNKILFYAVAKNPFKYANAR